MTIKENVILAPYTTFGIGGPARYFCEVVEIEDLKNALKFSRENKLRFFVLGGGSNILISDNGFDGLIIRMAIKGLEFDDELLRAGAGENWDYIVEQAVERGLCGIENLSLIPGTAGAAVYQNIGAYGVELKDVLESAEALDVNSGKIITISNKECCFGYRDSIFKHKEGIGLVVLGICLKLSKNQKPKINYPDLVKIFEGKEPSISEVRSAVIKIRFNKLPYPNEAGNAGSFFKNPTVTETQFNSLIFKHSDLRGFCLGDDLIKLSAGQLIEKCGWKGRKNGGVGVSEKHSLVLINHGKGTADQILDLAGKITESVKNEFGVVLEPEVQMVA